MKYKYYKMTINSVLNYSADEISALKDRVNELGRLYVGKNDGKMIFSHNETKDEVRLPENIVYFYLLKHEADNRPDIRDLLFRGKGLSLDSLLYSDVSIKEFDEVSSSG